MLGRRIQLSKVTGHRLGKGSGFSSFRVHSPASLGQVVDDY